MAAPPTAYLLHGYLGVGKTSLARAWERERGARRFTHDEWMTRLYGDDPPAAEFADRYRRVAALMEAVWTRCLDLGVSVILDSGFWSRAERDRGRALVVRHGGRAVLVRVSCPEDVARRRVAARNARLEGSLYIAPTTYDALRGRFEPLGADEERVEVEE